MSKNAMFLGILAVLCVSAAHVEDLTDANFDEMVLNSPDYWLVDFYAPW